MPKYIYNEINGQIINSQFIIIETKQKFGVKILDLKIKSVNSNTKLPKVKVYRVTKTGVIMQDKNFNCVYRNKFLHLNNILVSPEFSFKLEIENEKHGSFSGQNLDNFYANLKFKGENGINFVPVFEATVEENRSFSL